MKYQLQKNVPNWVAKFAAQIEMPLFHILLGVFCLVLASIEWITETRYPPHAVLSWLSRFGIFIFILLGAILIYKGFISDKREGAERNWKDGEAP